MSGSKFSTSRGTVIYVGDFLREFGPDALRYFIAVAGPENQDTDFTWDEFVRRTNFELANEWGNLVNRSISLARRTSARSRTPTRPEAADAELLALSRAAFTTVGATCSARGSRRRPARRCAWSARPTPTSATRSPGSARTTRSGGTPSCTPPLQVVQDANTLLTPFLPHAAQQVHEALGGTGVWAAQPAPRTRSRRGRAPPTASSPATTRRAGPVGVHADPRRAPAGPADAAVHEARRRRWGRPARRGRPSHHDG